MTFSSCLEELRQLLINKYPTINFTDDIGVVNKLEDLAYIIAKRNNVLPPKQSRGVEIR